jgi:hypothetical protein
LNATTGGVENAGMMRRPARLGDLPADGRASGLWNGWLTVGVPERPSAAWNPVAGFTDPAGRLLWLTLSDPAFFPSPHGTGWIPNRVTVASVELGAPILAVPAEALALEPGTGALRVVGPAGVPRARGLPGARLPLP